MLGTLGAVAIRFFGPRALKAVAGAITAGAGVAVATASQNCNLDAALGPYIGTAGVALVSYLVTYLVPNRPDK